MSELVVDQITKQYVTRAQPLEVLRGCSLKLARGENLAILGPSGSGKSTLLQIIGTLDTPTSGTVRLAGEDPFSLDPTDLAQFRNHRIGFVFQDHHLLPQCTVYENVLLPTLAASGATHEACRHADMLLERVGLSARRDHRPAELSGGERQRAAIARALICKPLLLLADEPTGNLDHTTAQAVADLMFALQHEEQTMLIVVTHSLELASRFQRSVELDQGQLVERSSATATTETGR